MFLTARRAAERDKERQAEYESLRESLETAKSKLRMYQDVKENLETVYVTRAGIDIEPFN